MMLRGLLDDHRDVVTMLAEGFKECKKHVKVGQAMENYLGFKSLHRQNPVSEPNQISYFRSN